MATRTDFYLGSGPTAQWVGSLLFACHPDNLLKHEHGRAALTAREPSTYCEAVDELLMMWPVGGFGAAHAPRHGWPWDWETSHVNDWILTYLPGPDSGVHMTAGGGDRWHRLDPAEPRPPLRCGPPDFAAWLRDPSAAPAVPLPLYRACGTPSLDYSRALWRQP